jgi:hypothetical protein
MSLLRFIYSIHGLILRPTYCILRKFLIINNLPILTGTWDALILVKWPRDLVHCETTVSTASLSILNIDLLFQTPLF